MSHLPLSRRHFLAGGTAAAVVGLDSLGQASAIRSAGEKLNVALVGVGKGSVGGVLNLPRVARENVVALCDIDEQNAGPNFEKFPRARRWTDFRRMLDKQKDIDAVVVSTPDHSHATIAITAMRHGKHVYCEKPLARTIGEVRRMREVARETKVVTQMGNHGTYEPTFRKAVEIIQSGAIGQVTQVHTWSETSPCEPARPWNGTVRR